MIEEVLEECCSGEDTEAAIQNLLRRKRFDLEESTVKERQKMYAFLARKGFRYEDISRVIQCE